VLDDEHYMRLALDEAGAAARAGDVPVGAIIVDSAGNVIGRGRNRREVDRDPTGHAEVVALREAASHVGSWRLDGTALFVTLEPCPMCAGACVNGRVTRVVYGCDDPKAGAVRTLYAIGSDARLNHRFEVKSGVLAAECGRILSEFFAQLRKGS
jgi:tRNA(adenine34) deaminase